MNYDTFEFLILKKINREKLPTFNLRKLLFAQKNSLPVEGLDVEILKVLEINY